MDTTLGNFYLQVQFSSLTAVVWIGDNSAWRLIECFPDGEWPAMNAWRRGTWKTGDNGMARCYTPQPIHTEYYESTETVTKKVLEPLPVVKGQDSCLNQIAKRPSEVYLAQSGGSARNS